MTKQTTEDVLYDFYRKEDATVSRDYFGEQEIIIPHGTTGNGYAWRHSEFALDGTTMVYIANIPDLNASVFTQDGYYNNFYHTTSLADGVIDAEKSSLLSCDANMCWAATDSNLMFQTGWFTSVIENEDDILNLYRQSFLFGDSRYGDGLAGADWYLTGHYAPNNPNPEIPLDECLVGTGGFFSTVVSEATDYVYWDTATLYTSSIIQNAVANLKNGNVIGLRVAQCKWGENDRAHIITLQGYTYELNVNNNTEKITGVIVADSDDDMDAYGGSSYAPNVLKIIPVHYILGDVYLDWNYLNYMSDGWSPWKMTDTMFVAPANFTTLTSNGAVVCQGATLLKESVGNNETMDVFQNGLAKSTTVLSGGVQNVSSGGSALRSLISPGGTMVISNGGTAEMTSLGGGNAQVFGGGVMILDNQAAASGNVTLGGQMVVGGSINCNYLTVGYDLDADTSQNDPLITNLSNMGGINSLALNIDWMEKFGTYTLASSGGDFLSNKSVYVYDTTDNNNLIKTLNNQSSTVVFSSGAIRTYNMEYTGGVLTLEVGGVNANKTTACDFHYNGISDVIYISGGTGGQLLRYGLDGASGLQDMGNQNTDMQFVGGYDMTSDHKADLITFCKYDSDSSHYIEIGYAESGDLSRWHSFNEMDIHNPDNVDWNVYCGNLTGNAGKNSILWHAPDLGILGYWADAGGNASWSTIGSVYDSDWEVLGMGDFSNDSVHKDAVLFKYGINTIVEITASGGFRSLGILGDGWEVATIGDFSNDGVDDLILYNAGSGLVGKWADGVSTGWSSLGTVETGVAIEGAGDYNGDGSMDLLARKSDGTMGYYASANVSQFTSFGYTMDSGWTVIA